MTQLHKSKIRRVKLSNAKSQFTLLMLLLLPNVASAVNLNYDSLSSLEEPLAVELGDTTLLLSGLFDLPVFFDLKNDADTELGLRSNLQITAETQLSNSWTLGAGYFGSYLDSAEDSYRDNAALYIGGVWGTVSIGNVTGMVREETRLNRGVGNALLSYDNFIGGLDDKGLAYVGRFGPSRLSANIDDNSNIEIGWVFQRPLGNKDYRFSARLQSSEATIGNQITFDSKGVSGVAELTYGSSIFEFGVGYETLESHNLELDRWFIASGIAYKVGRWTLSAQGQFGEIEDQNERSYAAGIIYDVARGLSLNLGLNNRESNIEYGGITIRNDDSTEGIFSLRYSY